MTKTRRKSTTFFAVKYEKSNEGMPSDLYVFVNGIHATLKSGKPVIIPRFLLDEVKQRYNIVHDNQSGNSSYSKFKNSLDFDELPDEFQTPEGVKAFADGKWREYAGDDIQGAFWEVTIGVSELSYDRFFNDGPSITEELSIARAELEALKKQKNNDTDAKELASARAELEALRAELEASKAPSKGKGKAAS